MDDDLARAQGVNFLLCETPWREALELNELARTDDRLVARPEPQGTVGEVRVDWGPADGPEVAAGEGQGEDVFDVGGEEGDDEEVGFSGEVGEVRFGGGVGG